jgi:nitrite reductase/ring-hydroxylating ferredoxin subunit
MVRCPWHGWEFDVRTGECITVPETIDTYKVVVEDGLVKVVI